MVFIDGNGKLLTKSIFNQSKHLSMIDDAKGIAVNTFSTDISV